MKNKKFLTILGVMLAMGLTACGGGKSSAQPQGSSEPEQSQSQGGESSQQGGESSQQGGSQSQQSSQQGGESSQGGASSSAHEHEFGEWGAGKAATYTEFGSEERSCACGEKEERDTNTLPFNIDQASEVMMLNSGNKKVYQYTYNNGAAKVAAVPMKEISGGFKTEAVAGEKEKWTIGADANQAAADTYKLSNSGTGMALLFKVNVKTAINNAFISIGGKFSNNNPRYFKNHGDGGQNGDNPDNDAYRYYTKVNEGEFTPIAYNNLMSSVFGDGKSVCYMPLGKFNLKAGENDIYVRQSNLGYRVTLEGYLYVDLGAAGEIDGTVPSHNHTPATQWSSDDAEHWHACSGTDCDEPGIKLDKAAHTFGEQYDVVAATCSAKGSYKQKCTVCDYVKTVETPKLAHTLGDAQAKVGDATPYECSVCHQMVYQLDIASPAKLKKDISWNITGLPAGTYEILLNACASATTLLEKYDSRYQFKVDDGSYIGASNDNATYASYGLGTGEALENVQWSSAINQIAIAEGAASFTIHWTNKGYSAFIAAIRLVKIA
jgi:hypothetical protein